MSYIFTKGATSQSIELYIIDSTNGTPETGVLWNTAGIDLKYRRKDAVVVSITEAALTSPALTDTWESGGFLEIGNGVYRLDLPDAVLASAAGIDRVVVFGTVTGMVVLPVTIHLTAFDLSTASAAQTADNETRLATIETDTNEIQGKLPTNKFMGSSDGADDDGNIAAILTDTGTTLENRQVTIAGDVANIDGASMVGTDNAALASVLGAAVGASISADIAAVKSETATIVTDTNEIQGKLPTNKFMGSSDGADDDGNINSILAGTVTNAAGADVAADIIALKTVADAVKVVTDNLASSATTIVSGTVAATAGSTTTIYSDDITEATADHYNGRIIIFTSGDMQNQATDITDYVLEGGEGKFTVTATTETAAENVTFVIV